ncbi:hypothetical protein K501DRAFT_270730 [Backusella circina FSU 941]|nr:hypothetical protein K501DRAFT_270730 [Backusella circina FSU 941]
MSGVLNYNDAEVLPEVHGTTAFISSIKFLSSPSYLLYFPFFFHSRFLFFVLLVTLNKTSVLAIVKLRMKNAKAPKAQVIHHRFGWTGRHPCFCDTKAKRREGLLLFI